MSVSMVFSYPEDPFGTAAAEQAMWLALHEAGGVEAILLRQDEETLERERRALERHISGQTVEERCLLSKWTIHHFLDRLGQEGEPVRSALTHWKSLMEAQHKFMTGRCHEFALAAHEATGWPMLIVQGAYQDPTDETSTLHVLVDAGEGMVLDVLGLRPMEEVERWYGEARWRWLDASPEEVLARTDLAAIQDMDEAWTAFETVTGGLHPRPTRQPAS